MTEQYGTYAPPPEVPGQPPAPQPMQAPAPRKSKVGLIIGILVALLLLGCGCATLGGYLLFTSAEETVTETFEYTDDVVPDAGEADRLAEWLAWNPETIQQLPEAPPGDAALIDDALTILAPDMRVVDTAFSVGFYDPAEDYYYGDMYLLRAVHPSSDKVSAGIEFTLQSEDMIADDVPFETYEEDVIDLIGDGEIEMISHGPFGNADYPMDSAEGVALWKHIGEDWPDAVVMWIDTETPGQVVACITKWRLYAIEDYSPRLWAVYEFDGDAWSLLEWEYELPDDMPEEPVVEAPVT